MNNTSIFALLSAPCHRSLKILKCLPLSPVAYFGAIVASIDRLSLSSDSSSSSPNRPVDALVTLLSLIMPRISVGILRKKKVLLLELLVRVLRGGNNLSSDFIAAGLNCVSSLLVIRDSLSWSDVSQFYGFLLGFVTQSDAKRYIVKRWTKDAMCTKVDDHVVEESGVVPSSVWRLKTLRNFNKLIIMSQNDMGARNIMEAAFTECQKRVELLVGSSENAKQILENDGTQSLDDIYEDGNLLETGNIGDGGVDEVNEDGPNGSQIEMDDIGCENDNELNIKDPIKKRKKGVRNIRLKSTQEKICNKLKGKKLKSWKKRTGTGVGKMKSKAQKSVKEYLDVPGNSCVAHPTNPEAQLQFHGHDDYFGINVTPFGN
ncbi:hypothetical protein BVRB_8g190550 [Beta vulgaris subsp. vulgaris]|nr:hypothetical protein BVRB_8g190550 [Beta vulgaris subsp. vulgaris]